MSPDFPDPGRPDSRQAHHLRDQKDWEVDISGRELRKHTEEQLKQAHGGKLAFNGLQLQKALPPPSGSALLLGLPVCISHPDQLDPHVCCRREKIESE